MDLRTSTVKINLSFLTKDYHLASYLRTFISIVRSNQITAFLSMSKRQDGQIKDNSIAKEFIERNTYCSYSYSIKVTPNN